MKSYSIILLKDSSKGVHQYHLGGKFIFFLLLLFLTGAVSLSWIYFDQYLKIANQRQLLEKQELAKSAYQKQIDNDLLEIFVSAKLYSLVQYPSQAFLFPVWKR